MKTTIPSSIPPMGKKPQSRARVWLIRAGLALMAMPIVLALIGVTYQAVAGQLDRRHYPPPGQLVDVGGYRLHLYCMGVGTPTIILEAANQGTVSNWIWIQPALAQTTRVCAYDRAGQGWSDLSPEPQDTLQNAQALHSLLNNANVPGPYVLVGHSLGGFSYRCLPKLSRPKLLGWC